MGVCVCARARVCVGLDYVTPQALGIDGNIQYQAQKQAIQSQQ